MDDERPIDRGGLNACTGGMVLLLVVIFLVRALHPGQAIVENYVGRQIPTAMVARNIDRGLGFFRPQLETAPFPNYFVVEPPIYELLAVGVKRATSLGLAESGRVSSALVSVLAGWGVFALARRREGRGLRSWPLPTFAVFPLTIRYGRAFQPDAAMLGADRGGPGVLGSVAGAPEPCLAVGGLVLAGGRICHEDHVGLPVDTALHAHRPRGPAAGHGCGRGDAGSRIALVWLGGAFDRGGGRVSRVARQSVDLAGAPGPERTAGSVAL